MKFITTVSLLASVLVANADTNTDQSHFQQVIQNLSKQQVKVESVNETPINGIKEIVVKSGAANEIIYMSDDGQFMFDGQLTNLKSQKNLTLETEKNLRHELLVDFKKTHKSIDFLPANMTDHITVFTDIDCGYCRKLHQEVDQYNDLGIGVSYLFFPRAGLNTASHQKAVNVWCATDQQQAMTSAKNGETLEPLMCPNPIESQFNLGLGAGVHKVGTPAVVFADGTMMPGYLPAGAMKQRIESIKKQK
ncbi:thioredoxin fold domain-containing protein [Marinicella litoralis]|uniref:Thiol:disulfide interchange protein n=1 Tax=Marinicella litoralis TaxID=644220 RepID=A0A4R6XLM9_9GAMM|nr:thioredoxin fold domain-containing protein [Marinicella litoralis]TDR20532.1 thiol:disulfide interchange protein DsbC [Marinicella litoralis]